MSRAAHGSEDRAEWWEGSTFCRERKQDLLVVRISGAAPETFELILFGPTIQYVEEEWLRQLRLTALEVQHYVPLPVAVWKDQNVLGPQPPPCWRSKVVPLD